jgi:hypothetical protein
MPFSQYFCNNRWKEEKQRSKNVAELAQNYIFKYSRSEAN